jgi:NAD(P)H-hydrate epimerase
MNEDILSVVKTLQIPKPDSHKGQNGRLLVVGGSQLFHAASLWSLTVASRIVDLVHYCSIPVNNEIVQNLKEEFRNGIVVPREEVDAYIKEDDVILIGPGMTRDEETKTFTDRLLKEYQDKQWVIDAGALQMMELSNIPKHAILTPHHQEFSLLTQKDASVGNENFGSSSVTSVISPSVRGVKSSEAEQNFVSSQRAEVTLFAQKYQCIVLLKGKEDIASNGIETRIIEGGNAGMTKGGTGDVLAGLIAALACINDPWIATIAGSYINKTAGDDLFQSMGPFFNATDLANQIPKTMKRLLFS